MTTRHLMLAVAALALLLGLISFCFEQIQRPHIDLMIFNETTAPISDLQVRFLNGERTAKELRSGGVAVAEIQSGGDAGVFFAYRDSGGNLRKAEPVHYSEDHASLDRGFLEVHVTNEGLRVVKQIDAFDLLDVFVLRYRVSPSGEMAIK